MEYFFKGSQEGSFFYRLDSVNEDNKRREKDKQLCSWCFFFFPFKIYVCTLHIKTIIMLVLHTKFEKLKLLFTMGIEILNLFKLYTYDCLR